MIDGQIHENLSVSHQAKTFGFLFFLGVFFSLQIGSIDLFHQTKVICEIATALFSFANIRNFLWKNEESHNWSN